VYLYEKKLYVLLKQTVKLTLFVFFADNPTENGVSFLNPPPGQLLLKILIPGYAAGAVIGKGGQIIVQLQKDSGAIIKLSKAKDFYPGQ